MKKLILATASVLVLGIAGAGLGQAQTPGATMPPGTRTATAPVTQSPTQIKNVQHKLRTAGFYNGPINGRMNSQTKMAVPKFQRRHGLPQTGTLNQRTLAALNHTTSGSGSSLAPGAHSSRVPSNLGAGSSSLKIAKPSTRPSGNSYHRR